MAERFTAGSLPAQYNPGLLKQVFQRVERAMRPLWYPHTVNVRDYGAKGNGSADDTQALLDAMDDAPTGARIVFPKTSGYYAATAALPVTKSLQFFGPGEVRQTTSNTGLWTVTASGVRFQGLRMVGPQSATQQVNESAVNATAASYASPLTKIVVVGCEIESWGFYGVKLKHVVGFDVSGNLMDSLYQAGIQTLSARRGVIQGNRITDVVGSGNVYGIALSRDEMADLTVAPRTADVTITGNLVWGVANWAGINSHAGERLNITGNNTYGCKYGITVGSADNDSNVATWAPLDCTITGNIVDSGLTDGTAQAGISFSGAGGAIGSPVELATGTVSGNVVRGHGDETSSTTAGILVRDSLAATVTGNTVHAPASHGIHLISDNYGITCTGNTVVDPWSETFTAPAAVLVGEDYNTGVIGNNSLVLGSKSATYKAVRGLRVGASLTNSALTVTDNRFGAAATPYSIGTAGAIAAPSSALPSATTVGAAGGASALPATPTGYITVNISGTDRKIPYYAT